jgi:hypothetical protein
MEQDVEEIIHEFFGDDARAAEWQSMHQALSDRLRAFELQLADADDPAEQKRLHGQVRSLRDQIAAIETEVAISRFVEDSIKVSLARPIPLRDDEEE